MKRRFIIILSFLPEASFGIRVLSLPASVHPSVRPSVRHQVCPCEISSPVQASNLRSKSKLTPFWAYPHHNSSPIQVRITTFGPEVQNTLVKIPVILGGGRLTLTFTVKFDLKVKFSSFTTIQGHIWLKKSNFLASPLLEIQNHHITTREPWVPRLLHRPNFFMVSILCMYLYT